MKKLFLLLLVIVSANSFASEEFLSNQECIDVYRTGYLNLQDSVIRFNDGSYNRFEFAGDVSLNSSAIGISRAACLAVENDSVTKCVTAYKDLYKDLREQIKLGAILSGNQTHVTYSKKMQQVIEQETREVKDDSLMGKLKRSLRLGAAAISETFQVSKDITMLEFIDMKCGN